MKIVLASLTAWQASAWAWLFYLEEAHGAAYIIEPNKWILAVEFSGSIALVLCMIGYLGYRFVREWRVPKSR